MENIHFGIDLGSNSIGWAKRNSDLSGNQIEKYGVVVFKTGVGKDKAGEYSFASRRTEKRSIRRLYQARKYRLWATLQVLIENKMCPMEIEELDLWRKSIKGRVRQYPIIEKFENWIKLDFNNDGKPDYISPYQLRMELTVFQLDLNNEIDRFKLGRALYHIAQRRGFKSSKGETIKEQEKETQELLLDEMPDKDNEELFSIKKSELDKRSHINQYIEKRQNEGVNLFTIGSAFADIENQGMRVRLDWGQYTIRQQYESEIQYIFNFQNDLDYNGDFYKEIHKAIFYKRPLRSQKGSIGKCTLEPQKSRCPISHPDFETFRAWSFINNIRIKREYSATKSIWEELPLSVKKTIFDKLFMRIKKNFNFSEISDLIQKETNSKLFFNYKAKTNVSGCPVSARLRNILGSEWKNWTLAEPEIRTRKDGSTYEVSYNWEDIWHIWFSFEDEEFVSEYAKTKLELDPQKIKQFVTGWASLPVGYAMLSLKAIKNINRFLEKGLMYTDSVLLAKIPDILGDNIWIDNQNILIEEVNSIIAKNRNNKIIYNIVNSLISKYKALSFEEQYAYKNEQYRLDKEDVENIKQAVIGALGEKKYAELSELDQIAICDNVHAMYQNFFSSSQRNYCKLPRVVDELKSFLLDNFSNADAKKINTLYHPSMIEFYSQVKDQENFDGIYAYQLPSPQIGSFKNPMAMRTLFELRKLLNYLLKTGEINEETRMVVEVARELNDANKRWAIEAYQRQREAENKEFENVILAMLNDPDFSGIVNPENKEDIDKLRIFSEQIDIKESYIPIEGINKTKNKKSEKIDDYKHKSSDFLLKLIAEKDLIRKYRLWKEQEFRCIYTNKIITITNLFAENVIDFEHTIPRSISFDNSLANLTVCYADFNRTEKKNQMPSQLRDYDKILDRISSWKEKVERLKDNIEFWKKKSKNAATKEYKDNAIRQRHLWQMELDYWHDKVSRFEMKEVTSGFRNRQLTDTQIISKYAYHYLKSVFQKVDIQKGSTTAEFRKIYGIQEKKSKKDRTLHSHHAKDAGILTLIPTAVKRDEILEQAYKYRENGNHQYHTKPYPEFDRSHLESIDETILINNINRDKALGFGKKIIRKRGKIVYIIDKDGNEIPKVAQGDCVRGQLHQDTFLGANKVPQLDENGKWLKDENGKIIFKPDLLFVKREQFVYKGNSQSPGFASLDDIKNKIVDKGLYYLIEQQVESGMQQGKSFKEIMNDGIWHKGSSGKMTRIRHLRVKTSTKDPLVIKKQSHISTKENKFLPDKKHKQFYYAINGENYCFALYQGIVKNKVERAFKLYGLFDVAGLYSIDNKLIIPEEKQIKKDISIPLYAILKHGQKVLFYRDNEENLEELTSIELSKRLYKIFSFEQESEGKGRIALQHHLDSSTPSKTGENVSSSINFDNPSKLLRISKENFNFLIEGKDFNINPDGAIEFL